MLVEGELARVLPPRGTLLTIGVFDGVHLGHKHLISQLVAQSRKQDLLSGVITFRQHPQDFFLPETRLPFLTDLEERAFLLNQEGVDLVVPISFDSGLAQLDAREFVNLLQKYLKMEGLVLGPDFALGKNREGDEATLRNLGRELNYSVSVVAPLNLEGEPVSSTAIRKAIARGDMEKAERLMGRPFSLHGKVVSGTRRGKGLGFPTANLDLNQAQALPTDGVYASWASVNGKTYSSMTNIGKNPTFGGTKRIAEVHLLDYQGDLYGRELKIDIVKRLRAEKKYDSVEALKKQIAEDIVHGKMILTANSSGEAQ